MRIRAAPYLRATLRKSPLGLLCLVAFVVALNVLEPSSEHPHLVRLALLALGFPFLLFVAPFVYYVCNRIVPNRWILRKEGIRMRGLSFGSVKWEKVSRWVLQEEPDRHFRLRVWEGDAVEHQIIGGESVSPRDVRRIFALYHQVVPETVVDSGVA